MEIKEVKNNIVEYIKTLEKQSFEGWTEDEIDAYLTALHSVKKKIQTEIQIPAKYDLQKVLKPKSKLSILILNIKQWWSNYIISIEFEILGIEFSIQKNTEMYEYLWLHYEENNKLRFIKTFRDYYDIGLKSAKEDIGDVLFNEDAERIPTKKKLIKKVKLLIKPYKRKNGENTTSNI